MNNISKTVKVINDYQSQELIDMFIQFMSQERPLFCSRIGGSDYEIVVEYFNNKKLYKKISVYDFIPSIFLKVYDKIFYRNTLKRKYNYAVEKVKKLNGYFDFNSNRSNFIKYLEEMSNSYKNSDCFLYAGANLIYKFENNRFNKNDFNFINYILENKVAINYTFIEAVLPFIKSFKIWGENKRILIVSPLSKSIEFQYKRKNDLINNYQFPNFKLLTYNTKVTYNTKNDSMETLGIITNNWNEELDRIKDDIRKMDFDIALLSCGSYSMSLGNYIKNMGKKSIYLGGVLNVIFNIYGKRYDTPFFNNIVNLDSQINPIENNDILKILGGKNMKNESFNAYFGTRKQ